MRETTAYYTGICAECQGPITPGQAILWTGEAKTSHHVVCPAIVPRTRQGDDHRSPFHQSKDREGIA